MAPSPFVSAATGHLAHVLLCVDDGTLDSVDEPERRKGDTLTHRAAGAGHAHVVAALLERNANATKKNDAGETPLHAAAAVGSIECVRLLLAVRGVSALARDNLGRMPLHAAAANGHARVVDEFVRAHQGPDGAIAVPRADNVRYVDERDIIGMTPLHHACRHGHASAAATLLEASADTRTRARGGASPLHDACRYAHHELVRALMAHEAFTRAQRLMEAMMSGGDAETPQALEPLVDAVDDKGMTPEMIASALQDARARRRTLAALHGDEDDDVDETPQEIMVAPAVVLSDADILRRDDEKRAASKEWKPFAAPSANFLP